MRLLLWIAGGCVVGGGLAVGALVMLAAPEPGHGLLHVGCLNHNHGPKWHADHGRAIGQVPSRFARPDENADDKAERRSTRGR